jgi:hypothetical protein
MAIVNLDSRKGLPAEFTATYEFQLVAYPPTHDTVNFDPACRAQHPSRE